MLEDVVTEKLHLDLSLCLSLALFSRWVDTMSPHLRTAPLAAPSEVPLAPNPL